MDLSKLSAAPWRFDRRYSNGCEIVPRIHCPKHYYSGLGIISHPPVHDLGELRLVAIFFSVRLRGTRSYFYGCFTFDGTKIGILRNCTEGYAACGSQKKI